MIFCLFQTTLSSHVNWEVHQPNKQLYTCQKGKAEHTSERNIRRKMHRTSLNTSLYIMDHHGHYGGFDDNPRSSGSTVIALVHHSSLFSEIISPLEKPVEHAENKQPKHAKLLNYKFLSGTSTFAHSAAFSAAEFSEPTVHQAVPNEICAAD